MNKTNIPSAPPQEIVAHAYVVDQSSVYIQQPQMQYVSGIVDSEENKTKEFDTHEFREFVEEYEISEKYAKKLRQLESYDIVFICDDSGSMKSPVTTPNTKSTDVLPTRWTEMQNIVKIVTKLSIILDDNGIDVYMLNRNPMYNVQSENQLNDIFKDKPKGCTPILKTLRQVIKEKSKSLAEKNLLIIIATDGEPTDVNGEVIDKYGVSETEKLFCFLRDERKPAHKIHTTILACTDDNKTMEYLENWDQNLENFDVVDDYYSERERIQNEKGKNYRFSFGDYIVKILLGSIDPELDNLDGSEIYKEKQSKQTICYYNKQYVQQQTKKNNSNACIIC